MGKVIRTFYSISERDREVLLEAYGIPEKLDAGEMKEKLQREADQLEADYRSLMQRISRLDAELSKRC